MNTVTAPLLERPDAARLARALRLYALDSYGGREWREQNAALERLAIHASLSVRQGGEEFVADYLMEFGKLPMLVEQLVHNEAWRAHVFPLVRGFLAAYSGPFAYTLLQQNATILNLLQTTLYKRESLDAAGDALLDLIDVVAAGMARLLAASPKQKCNTEKNNGDNDDEKIESKVRESAWRASWAGVACLCHMTHHMRTLSVSAVVRIVEHHEIINMLVMLLAARSTWEQTHASLGNNGAEGGNAMLLQGQLWLTLGNLLLNYRYKLTSTRKTYMMTLLRILDAEAKTLHAQFPFLEHVHRAILYAKMQDAKGDEASLCIDLAAAATKAPPQIVLLPCFTPPKHDWNALAQNLVSMWRDTQADTHTAKLLAATYDLDTLESLLPDEPRCSRCGSPASFKCSACRNEWYCARKCQVKAWPAHKKLCKLLSSSSTTAE